MWNTDKTFKLMLTVDQYNNSGCQKPIFSCICNQLVAILDLVFVMEQLCGGCGFIMGQKQIFCEG